MLKWTSNSELLSIHRPWNILKDSKVAVFRLIARKRHHFRKPPADNTKTFRMRKCDAYKKQRTDKHSMMTNMSQKLSKDLRYSDLNIVYFLGGFAVLCAMVKMVQKQYHL